MEKVLAAAKKKVTPSKKEVERIAAVVKEIKETISKVSKKRGYLVDVFVGGSVGKGTWLPGMHDIDVFMRFDYKKYKDKDNKISDYAEEILLNCFEQVLRLHGSRDYFQTEHKGYELEFVPNLGISKYTEAKNTTDASPLHVIWSEKKEKEIKGIKNEIRVAKSFFRGAKVYGAESYINGFSGHVIDILTIHYGGFRKMIEAVDGWEKGMIVDIENYYNSRDDLLKKMNDSKTYGPMIVVDPVQPERNCAAALNLDNFEKLKKAAADFLKRPSIYFFEEKKIGLESLKRIAKKEGKKIVYIEAAPESENQDVAGSKIMKTFKYLMKHALLNDFEVTNPDWEWDKDIDSKFRLWFFTSKKDLSSKKILWGPPETAKKEFINSFKSKHSIQNIKKKNGKFYVEAERIFQRIEQLISELDNYEPFKNFSFRVYNG